MIRLALIGTGSMARIHAERFNEIRGCRICACCDTLPGRARSFADTHGIPRAYESPEEMFDSETLDAVSVVTPDRVHAAVSLAAIERGLHVMCEKPLSDTLEDAVRMEAAAGEKGVLTAVNFSYRNQPATQKAARMVSSGRLGRIMHVEGSYLQSWLTAAYWGDWHTTPAWLWRLSTAHGSMGCLGDIGVHLYDLATFIAGDIAEVDCRLETFSKDVPRIDDYVFDANDSFVSMVRFKGGALGALHSSRWATGHVNSVSLRVFGEEGSLDLDLDRPAPERLRVCIGRKARDKAIWRAVTCPAVPDMYQRFITSIRTGVQGQTGFSGARKVQRCLNASVESDRAKTSIPIK